jgi:hypothetical protein
MDQKIIVIVSSDAQKQEQLAARVAKHFSFVTVNLAEDGQDGVAKLKIVVPHVLLVDLDLQKDNSNLVVDEVLEDPDLKSVAIVITDPPPKNENYGDELVTGRVQFLMDEGDEAEFVRTMNKALNFSSVNNKKIEFRTLELAPGRLLMKEGEKAEYVYILRRGQLEAYQIVDSKKVTLGYVEPGEYVGEMAMINGESRTASVVAVKDSELIIIPIGTFEVILYKRPAWAKAMMHILTKRLKQSNAALGNEQ